MNGDDKPLVWLKGQIKTPPFSEVARIEVGMLLRRLQRGDSLGLPHSRPMPSIGRRCHELRILDEHVAWRIIYRVDSDAIVIGEVFPKKSGKTPHKVIDICRQRFKAYDQAVQ
ncbi:MAG: type II toxin-antitoxin system RelE/ParE family toxin [Planctomycetia bacterium]|nr:type II toxin-antitoxin system RelE/ParE family toxin [Planctomycetia bacterium]